MNTKDKILHGMAVAFFACAWADAAEDAGQEQIMSGREILSIMPTDIDPSALHAAKTLCHGIESAHPGLADIELIYKACTLMDSTGADRALTPDLFGHAVRDKVRVPYIEFGSHSLEREYFQ